jgi:hypothetical protein
MVTARGRVDAGHQSGDSSFWLAEPYLDRSRSWLHPHHRNRARNGENRTGEPRLQHQTIAVPETHRGGIAPEDIAISVTVGGSTVYIGPASTIMASARVWSSLSFAPLKSPRNEITVAMPNFRP